MSFDKREEQLNELTSLRQIHENLTIHLQTISPKLVRKRKPVEQKIIN